MVELSVHIPGIRLVTLNQRLSVGSMRALYAARARAARQRSQVQMVLRSRLRERPAPPLVVTITRVAPRELDDDNLTGAAKYVRDGVADWLGVDDRTSRSGVTWRYDQRKGRTYGVDIHLRAVR